MTTRLASSLRLLAWAGLLAAFAYFMTVGGTYLGIASVRAQIATQLVAYLILGAWLLLAIVRPAWRPMTPLLVPVALASAAYALSGLLSQRPRLSLEPALGGLALALTFLFLTRIFADPWFRRRAEVVFIVGVAIVAVGYVVQVVLEWVTWWGIVRTAAVPPLRPSFAGLWFDSPNLVATFLFFLAPLAIVIARERTRGVLVPVLLAGASVTAVFLSGSRGAYLGVGFAVVVGVGLVASRIGLRQLLARAVLVLRQRPILLIPIGAMVAALGVFIPVVAYRFSQGGDTLRLDLWRSALTIFSDHPLTGGGPGTWVQLKVLANPPGVPNVVVPHAHNLYIQAAAELGLVGLAGLAVVVLAGWRRLHGAWRAERGERGALGTQAVAVMVGLAAFAGQSLVDNLVNLPFVCLELIAVVAWIDGGRTMAEGDRPLPIMPVHTVRLGRALSGAYLPAVVLAAMVLLVPTLVRIDRASLNDEAGNSAALSGDWAEALARYDAAHAADPDVTLYQLQRASALARVGRTADARTQLADAVQADQIGVNVIGLAVLDLATGDRAAAMEHARRAVDLAPGDPTVALNAGLIGEAVGDRTFALDEFANAVAWDPPLASIGLWTAPERIIAKGEVVDAARARSDPQIAALILAYAGSPSAARVELEAQPPSSGRDVLIAVTIWLGGDTAGAQERLAGMTARDPRDWVAAGWMARISRRSGDFETADRYARWATIVQADAASSVIGEASVVPADAGDATAGLPADYPWAVYLRPIAPYLPMPELTLIGTR